MGVEQIWDRFCLQDNKIFKVATKAKEGTDRQRPRQ